MLNHALKRLKQTGLRVDNIQLSMGQQSFNAQSFLSGTDILINIYFELPSGVRTAGSPVFTADFPAKIESLPDTSFIHWITKVNTNHDVVKLKSKNLVWLPKLADTPKGFTEEKLGLLSKRLTDEISKSSPEKQDVSLFGAKIPGILFIFASPMSLLALLYYFMNHSFHVLKLSKGNETEFSQFAWIPLSSEKYWMYEFSTSLIMLPVIALTTLYFQLVQFNSPGILPSAIIIISLLGVVFIGRIAIMNIGMVRLNIQKKRDEQEHTAFTTLDK